MRKLAYLLIGTFLIVTSFGAANAMSLTNTDNEARTVQITENGVRTEREVAANQTIDFCDAGCFITFPDGTLTAYQGSEKIVIRNGGPALAE